MSEHGRDAASDLDPLDGFGPLAELGEPAPPTRPRRPVIVWDVITSSILLIVMLAVGALMTFLSLLLAFAGDGCGATACDLGLISLGFSLALFGPGAIALLAIAAAVVLMAFRRISFWVPLAGIVLIVAVFLVGAAITAAGAPAVP